MKMIPSAILKMVIVKMLKNIVEWIKIDLKRKKK